MSYFSLSVCLSPVSHFGSPVSIPGQSTWDVVDKMAQGQNFVKVNCFPAYYHVVIASYLYFSSTIDITLVTRLHATWCRVEQASCQEREHCTGTSRTFSVCFKNFNSDWRYKCFERSMTLPGHSEVNLAAAILCQLQPCTMLGGCAVKLPGLCCSLDIDMASKQSTYIVQGATSQMTIIYWVYGTHCLRYTFLFVIVGTCTYNNDP